MGRIITVSATAAVIACVVGSTAALGYSPTLPGGNPSAAPTGPPSLPNCTTVEPPRGAPCFDALGMWEGQGSDVGPVYTQLHEASDCSSGCWKLSSVIFEGTNQRSALDHDIFVRMRWQNGTYISTYPNGPSWTAFWGPSWDKHDKDLYNLEAKLPPDYGNFPLVRANGQRGVRVEGADVERSAADTPAVRDSGRRRLIGSRRRATAAARTAHTRATTRRRATCCTAAACPSTTT